MSPKKPRSTENKEKRTILVFLEKAKFYSSYYTAKAKTAQLEVEAEIRAKDAYMDLA